jgi:hypothetical protein
MRFLSRLLDNAILLPGGYRIGFDPLIGLLPGAGDFLAGTLSVLLIYDAARLGISKRSLVRMALNVLFDSAVGTVPVVGDVFDAAWKANARNMRLVEMEYHPAMKERSFRGIALFLGIVLVSCYLVLGLAIYGIYRLIFSLFQ